MTQEQGQPTPPEPAQPTPAASPPAKLQREQMMEQRYQVGISPLLETIPQDLAETFHQLVSRLQLANVEGETTRLGVVSANHGEGVTIVARSLAIVLANDLDAKVCLVSMGRTPKRRSGAQAEPRPGLFDVIAHDVPLEDAIQPTADVRVSILDVGARDHVVVGQIARNPKMATVFDELEKEFDHIILDVPPILAGSEGLALLRHAYSYILVVKHGSTPVAHVQHTAEELKSLPCLGVVINQFSTRIPNRLRRFFTA
jgi:protein-tyrosine kinase